MNNGWRLLPTPLLPDCGGNVTRQLILGGASPSFTITDGNNSICNRTETLLSLVSCQVSGDRMWKTTKADFQKSVTVPGFPSKASESGKESYCIVDCSYLTNKQTNKKADTLNGGGICLRSQSEWVKSTVTWSRELE